MAYFSNGCEGEVLDNQCAVCPVGKSPTAPCPILLVQLLFNYAQHRKGNEELREAMDILIADKDGKCAMKPLMEEAVAEEGRHKNGRKVMDQLEDVLAGLRKDSTKKGT